MKSVDEELIRARAQFRCEYCHLPQAGHDERFSIDHVIPRKHGGHDADANLALACLRCNLCKGTNLSGVDVSSGQVVELFNPRRQKWDEHFAWKLETLTGLTPAGRASILVMNMNAPERLLLRRTLIGEGILNLH
jgi:hypothetical protein